MEAAAVERSRLVHSIGNLTLVNERLNPLLSNRYVKMGDLLKPLESIMDGGLVRGSLTLLEGASASGKSVLSQHLMHEALRSGDRVAYFTSQLADDKALASQMRSIGMRVDEHLLSNRLSVYVIQEPGPREDCGPMLTSLAVDIELMPLGDQVLIIDGITTLAAQTLDLSIFFSFLASCKQACAKGCTIILVIDSYALDEAVLVRLRAICDNHIALRSEKLRAKPVKTLEVHKSGNMDLTDDNTLTFEVQPKVGIHMLPVGKAKV